MELDDNTAKFVLDGLEALSLRLSRFFLCSLRLLLRSGFGIQLGFVLLVIPATVAAF